LNQARYISPSAKIIGDPDIGEGTWIGYFTVIDGSEGLTIGKNCSIASGVHIYTHSTHLLTSENGKRLTGKVIIGDNVAIGANSVILHGCVIGDGVVVPALTCLRPYTKLLKAK
jgi:carbonic anhydrase/acetyltransferase-like protein (isoleucine patch superfamily)